MARNEGRDLVRRITGMRILVIGSGAREHALLHSMSKDPQVGESDLHVAPGNAGMSQLATMHPVKVDDPAACAALADEMTTRSGAISSADRKSVV